MRRHIPNLLTAGRFILAVALFAVLAAYTGPESTVLGLPALDAALAVFIVACLTDAVDGYLARRLGHLTTFGRIADPFVDKIIVCGTLVYLIGDPFLHPGPGGAMENPSGWQPWMAVVIVARELLVTGMRSFSESHGIPFAATLSGKVKMFVQCVAIGWSLLYVGRLAGGPEWTAWTRDGLTWAATLVTGVSGLVYIKRAYLLLAMPPD
ncbi:MAG: CDP-diacylglycerol--glycerol-3-phosphate 3-phosphatidyltransferase [Planctomycetes bacterium]|nr:CDP-diacylglycerol--glycerol-3-phosphate 3-phosphatidyltransferase [Planctomycetota bacterium]